MAIKIIKEDEPLGVETLVVVLYGEPGIGKTSLSFTADKPLLEDYDDGLKRSVGRKTAVKFDRWSDAVDFHKSEEFKKIAPSTLIFDTGGTLLDNYMAQYVIVADPKNSRSGGELSLQGYGALKSVFKQFVAEMKAQKINLLFVCHTDTFKDGDNVKFKPKMTGGSYDILLAEADMVGYMESRNNKRSLSFSPTDRTVGKNTAEFGVIEVPGYTSEDYPGFMGRLIEKTKEKMLTINQAQQEAIEKVAGYRAQIETTADVDELIALHAVIDQLSPVYKLQLMALFEPKFVGQFDVEINMVTNAVTAQETLAVINTAPKVYIGKLQRKLWDKVQPLGIGYVKESNLFTDPPGKAAEPPAKETAPPPVEVNPATLKRGTSKKAVAASVEPGNLPLDAQD